MTIPNSVTSIGEGPVRGCSSLTAILVDTASSAYSSSGGVLFTKDGKTLVAYPGGKSGSYTIPSSVTNIAGLAFAWCRDLTGVTIPGSVTSIEDGAFDNCETLPAIQVDTGNPAYTSVDGVLFTKDGKTLVAHPSGKSTITYAIPDGVTGIANFAFSHCDSLTGVTIPNSVTSIGDCAFYSCDGLTGINIPNSVTSIGRQAFSYCLALTRVTIGNGVTSIEYRAFSDCAGLTDVYYSGSEAQWKKISVGSDNDPLANATIHYNSPAASGLLRDFGVSKRGDTYLITGKLPATALGIVVYCAVYSESGQLLQIGSQKFAPSQEEQAVEISVNVGESDGHLKLFFMNAQDQTPIGENILLGL